MMKCLSPSEHAQLWAEVDIHKGDSLGVYAEKCNKVKARWMNELGIGSATASNARYVVHLEECLRTGVDVPQDYIDSVTDDDLRYDGFCFPLLAQRRRVVA